MYDGGNHKGINFYYTSVFFTFVNLGKNNFF